MTRLRTAHTADLDAATLRAARALLDEAFGRADGFGERFGDGFDDNDWDHALGGVHALVWDGPVSPERSVLVAHGSVVQRRVLHGGRALRAGYVEAVAVRADRRRRGHATAVMDALERVVRGAYDLGALSASEAAADLYARRGWQRWQGTTWAVTPAGVVRTEEEDDSVYVLPGGVALDLSGELVCDWRDGDVW